MLPPASRPEDYLFVADKVGKEGLQDSDARTPMSDKAIQKMIRKCRDILAKAEEDMKYLRTMSKSERTSLGYWLMRDPSIPMGPKLRAIRMDQEATLHGYASKGFAQHDMKGVLGKFASSSVGASVNSCASS